VDEKVRVDPGEGVKRRYAKEARESILKNLEASLASLQHAKGEAVLFDIIYQPTQTTLLRLGECHGMTVLNGLAMNLYQAVIGFHKATEASELWSGEVTRVRDLMQEAGK
jgi:shikimate 5-dehydrogenase